MVKVDCSFHDVSSLQPALLHALTIASLHALPSGSDSVTTIQIYYHMIDIFLPPLRQYVLNDVTSYGVE